MLIWLVTSALASPPVEDRFDVWYLQETFRGELAGPWLAAAVEAAPDDGVAVTRWIEGRVQDWTRDSAVLRAQVEGWAADRGDSLDVRAARAAALALSTFDDRSKRSSSAPSEPGPWCAEAEALLLAPYEGPPAAPEAEWLALWWTTKLGDVCDWDLTSARDRMAALATSGAVGPGRALFYGLKDGMDEADAALVPQALAEQPWQLDAALGKVHGDAKGDGKAAVEAAFAEAAATLSSSDRPAALHLAARIHEDAGRTEQAIAARRHLAEVDPDDTGNQRRLERLLHPPEPEQEAEEAQDPETVIDPAMRLEALGERPPRGEAREVAAWWRARAEALHTLGRDEDTLEAYDHLWRMERGYASNLQFAALAAELGQRLRAAERAADIAVEGDRIYAFVAGTGEANTREEWRAGLADAHAARALVRTARGDRDGALQDLETSLLLDPDHPDRRVRLGLAYADTPELSEASRDLLAGALATGRLSEADREAARTALADALAATHTPTLGGIEAYVAAYASALAPAAPAAPAEEADPEPLPDFTLTLDGAPTTLSAIEGPVVLDLWATWCGPCKQGLPHFDQLARRFEGRATFVAVSVDDQQAKADTYLARMGDVAFTAAWAGDELMRELRVRGIPTYFVLDAAHRVVGRTSGYGPGDTKLDDLVARAVGGP